VAHKALLNFSWRISLKRKQKLQFLQGIRHQRHRYSASQGQAKRNKHLLHTFPFDLACAQLSHVHLMSHDVYLNISFFSPKMTVLHPTLEVVVY